MLSFKVQTHELDLNVFKINKKQFSLNKMFLADCGKHLRFKWFFRLTDNLWLVI